MAKIRELFIPTGVSQSFSGAAELLNQNNCKIADKTKNDDSILLNLKRDSDGAEAHAYLRVKNEFKILEKQLLQWAFAEGKIIGLTLNELENLETGLDLESMHEKIRLAKK